MAPETARAVVDKVLGFDQMTTRTSAVPDAFDFVGWGTSEKIEDLGSTPIKVAPIDPHKSSLGALASTAICGNDITSSCLYVSALAAAKAGVLAPVALAVERVQGLHRVIVNMTLGRKRSK